MRIPFKSRREPETSYETTWQEKQQAAYPSRYYGDGGTLHATTFLHIETHHGTVVSVWFRCQMLPFQQIEVGGERATAMEQTNGLPLLTGVEVRDLAGL